MVPWVFKRAQADREKKVTSSSTYSAIMLRVEIPATTCGKVAPEWVLLLVLKYLKSENTL